MLAKLVDKAREHVQKEYGLDKSYFKEVYLSNYDGCVPEDRIGEDLLKDIELKFYNLVGAVRDLVDRELRAKGKLGEREYATLYVSPSYEDCSTVLVIFRKHLVYLEHRKVWHYSWPNETEMEEYLREVYQTLKKNVEEVISGRDPK